MAKAAGSRFLQIRLIISHLIVAYAAFYVGCFHGVQVECSPCLPAVLETPRQLQDMPTKPTRIVTKSNVKHTDHKQFPSTMNSFAYGMGRVNRSAFVYQFDLGFAMDPPDPGNEEVLLIYSNKKSLPDELSSESLSANDIPLISSPEEATKNCLSMEVILTRQKDDRKCIAILGQWPSSYIQRWMRMAEEKKSKPSMDKSLRVVSRTHSPFNGEFFDSPGRRMVDRGFIMLEKYLRDMKETLEKLKPIAQSVVQGKEDNTIIVMVCNHGQSELFINMICSARTRGLDTSRILMFPTDIETKELAEELGITTYYDEQLFGKIPKQAASIYGDIVFTQMMMAKVYCVHLLNKLQYNVLFQDVDIVWYKQPLDYFLSPERGNFDIYFQDDGARTVRYEPFSPNTGFYFVRYNSRTEYFMSVLIRFGDAVYANGSHQFPLNTLLLEHSSLYGLRVKILSRDDDLFPGGFHYHRRLDYMRDLVQGKNDPYIFHMSWTASKANKLNYLEQMGAFHVKESCVGKTASKILKYSNDQDLQSACCMASPPVTCHYRDKPSKTSCQDSPPIDAGGKSFW